MEVYIALFTTALILSTISILLILYKFENILVSYRAPSLRDSHETEVSRFGGLGIAVGFLITCGLSLLLPESFNFQWDQTSISFLIGASLVFLAGVLDDIWTIRVRYKLLAQLLAAGYFALNGLSIEQVYLPLIGIIGTGDLALPLTVVWIVGVINAVNLIDGLDGLASGISMVALGFIFSISFLLGHHLVSLLSIILVGAIIGFWVFNRHPASIFMGDSGSLLLGFSLATLSLWGSTSPITGAVSLIPVMILAVPIIDTLFSFFRRYLKGIPFYSADQDHIHHRLLAKGCHSNQAVFILYGVSAIFGSFALLTHYQPQLYLLNILVCAGIGYCALFFLEYDEIKRPLKTMKNTSKLKKRRFFVLALSHNIDTFFSKDDTLDALLNSFSFWAGQMKVIAYSISVNRRLISKLEEPFALEKGRYRELVYGDQNIEIKLRFPENELSTDSDIKGDLINKAVRIFKEKLLRLYFQDAHLPHSTEAGAPAQEFSNVLDDNVQSTFEQVSDLKQLVAQGKTEEAHTLFNTMKSELPEALRLYIEGTFYGNAGDSRNALKYYLKSLSMLHTLDKQEDLEYVVVRATRATAITKCKLGEDYDGAIDLLEDLLSQSKITIEPKIRHQLLPTLAAVHYFKKDYNIAIQKFTHFIDMCDYTDHISLSQSYLLLSLCYAQLQLPDQAKYYFRLALSHFTQVQHKKKASHHFYFGWLGWVPLTLELHELYPILDEVFQANALAVQNLLLLYKELSKNPNVELAKTQEALQQLAHGILDQDELLTPSSKPNSWPPFIVRNG